MKRKLKLRKEVKAVLIFIGLVALFYGALIILSLRFEALYG